MFIQTVRPFFLLSSFFCHFRFKSPSNPGYTLEVNVHVVFGLSSKKGLWLHVSLLAFAVPFLVCLFYKSIVYILSSLCENTILRADVMMAIQFVIPIQPFFLLLTSKSTYFWLQFLHVLRTSLYIVLSRIGSVPKFTCECFNIFCSSLFHNAHKLGWDYGQAASNWFMKSFASSSVDIDKLFCIKNLAYNFSLMS